MMDSWRQAAQLFMQRGRRVLGVSFGASSAKLAEVDIGGVGAILRKTAELALPFDCSAAWETACAAKLAEAVRGGGMRPDVAVASLPEARLCAARLTLPPLAAGELAQALRWEAARRVPLAEGTYYYDCDLRGADGAARTGWLVAARREDVESLARVFSAASLPLLAVESERLALARLAPQGLALDVARGESRLLAFEQGALLMQQSLPIGGDAFTEAARFALDLAPEEAEAAKRRMSCAPTGPFGEVAERLARAAIAAAPAQEQSLFLLGGGACIDGLVETLAMRGLCARPLLGEATETVRLAAAVSRRDVLRYAGAVSLCLRKDAA